MNLKIGGSEVSKFMFDTTEVQKLYFNNQLVYQNSLPAGTEIFSGDADTGTIELDSKVNSNLSNIGTGIKVYFSEWTKWNDWQSWGIGNFANNLAGPHTSFTTKTLFEKAFKDSTQEDLNGENLTVVTIPKEQLLSGYSFDSNYKQFSYDNDSKIVEYLQNLGTFEMRADNRADVSTSIAGSTYFDNDYVYWFMKFAGYSSNNNFWTKPETTSGKLVFENGKVQYTNYLFKKVSTSKNNTDLSFYNMNSDKTVGDKKMSIFAYWSPYTWSISGPTIKRIVTY